MMDAQGVFQAALTLPESQRILLVERLLETLSPDDDALETEELGKELQRRLDEFKQDPSSAIPWEKICLEEQDN